MRKFLLIGIAVVFMASVAISQSRKLIEEFYHVYVTKSLKVTGPTTLNGGVVLVDTDGKIDITISSADGSDGLYVQAVTTTGDTIDLKGIRARATGTDACLWGTIKGIESTARAITWTDGGSGGGTLQEITAFYGSADVKQGTVDYLRGLEVSLDGESGGTADLAQGVLISNNSSGIQTTSYALDINSGTATNHKVFTADIRMQNGLTIDNTTDNALEINENSDELILTFGGDKVVVSSSDITVVDFGTIDLATDLLDATATALQIGDGDETVYIQSSDWTISTTGDIKNAMLVGSQIRDTATAVWNDSISVVRSEIVDTANVVRAEIRDTTIVIWNDSISVIRGVKLDTTLTSAYIFVGNATNEATGVALSGDGAITNAGVLDIYDSDSLGGQAPDYYLDTTLTATYIFVGNATNAATGVDMTGDVSITNAGVTSVNNADTCDYSKMWVDSVGLISDTANAVRGIIRDTAILVWNDSSATLAALYQGIAGDTANAVRGTIRDTATVVWVDSVSVIRGEIGDTANAVRGIVRDTATVVWVDSSATLAALYQAIAGDTAGVVRGEIRDTATVVWNDSLSVIKGLIADTSNAVRGIIRDTATVVWNDSLSVITGLVGDSANAVRGVVRDTATAVWTDSAGVILRDSDFAYGEGTFANLELADTIEISGVTAISPICVTPVASSALDSVLACSTVINTLFCYRAEIDTAAFTTYKYFGMK